MQPAKNIMRRALPGLLCSLGLSLIFLIGGDMLARAGQAAPALQATASATPTGTSTATGSLTPSVSPTITGTLSLTETLTATPTLDALPSATSTFPLFPTDTLEAEVFGGLPEETGEATAALTVTATLLPLPVVTYLSPLQTTTPHLLVVQHPPGSPGLPRPTAPETWRWLRQLWPLALLLGIWFLLILWFGLVQYWLGRRTSNPRPPER